MPGITSSSVKIVTLVGLDERLRHPLHCKHSLHGGAKTRNRGHLQRTNGSGGAFCCIDNRRPVNLRKMEYKVFASALLTCKGQFKTASSKMHSVSEGGNAVGSCLAR